MRKLGSMSRGTAVLFMFVLGAEAAVGDTSVGVDLDLRSRYVWRGLTVTDFFVMQPSVWVGLEGERQAWTAGVWGHLEATPSLAGLGVRSEGAGFGEVDYWVEWGWSTKAFELGFGSILYTYSGYPGDDLDRTAEIYSSFALPDLPLAPSVTVFYDVVAVRGAYVETELSHTVRPESSLPVSFGAAFGVSWGQGESTRRLESANFASDGLTHVDLSASFEWNAGSATLEPSVHYVVLLDEYARAIGGDDATGSRGQTLWFGARLVWSR